MLSICIPTHNYNISPLIKKLSLQIQEINQPIEIVILDDGSTEDWIKNNSDVKNLPFVKYHSQKNAGRSITRNRLAELASFNFLAFIDCDCMVNHNFIRNYINTLKDNTILVGGLTYPEKPTDKSKLLRWKFGITREVKSIQTRQKNPYKNFLSSNFIIPRQVFNKIRFNEELNGYGHEDTLLGIDFEINKIPIQHIDNPVCHMGLDTSKIFLEKIDSSLQNTKRISTNAHPIKNIKVLNTYNSIKKFNLDKLISTVFVLIKKPLRNYFINGGTNLFLLDIYKIGSYCLINKP